MMFGQVVLGIKKETYDTVMRDVRTKRNIAVDQELSISDLQSIVSIFKGIAQPPNDPHEQLRLCIEAVFNSWFSPRAIAYREIHGISQKLGTAVNIQSMVYGNLDVASGMYYFNP